MISEKIGAISPADLASAIIREIELRRDAAAHMMARRDLMRGELHFWRGTYKALDGLRSELCASLLKIAEADNA